MAKKKAKASPKKVSKKISKKVSKKVAKKATKKSKSSTKKVSKKVSRRKVSKVSSSNFSSPFSSTDDFPKSSPFPDSSYDDYKLGGASRFFLSRVSILGILGIVVLLIALWVIFTSDEPVDNAPISTPAIEENSDFDTQSDQSETQDTIVPIQEGTDGLQNEEKPSSNSQPVSDPINPEDKTNTEGTSPSQGQPTTTTTQAESSQPSKTYIIQAGDTLRNIARKTLGNSERYKEIMQLNSIRNPADIRVGQQLRIPQD